MRRVKNGIARFIGTVPNGKVTEAEAQAGDNLLDVGQALGMPLEGTCEGQMACSDCHNTHGSIGPALMKRDTVTETCYTCHAEKRGPFVHQHQPVTDNCANCHNPHDSTIPASLP